ncbi:family 78 glycoside hydrolase catalytic domain [Lentzea sp. NPDC092896]|uniref:family 78 glycoside hydrolase catalytic domain n=1 Tax=Lentzea sp. NPDC092896 TaxID=3364127 RepID=UPI00380E2D98
MTELPVTWSATWISPTDARGTPGARPAYALRGELVVTKPVRSAVLWATAHGIYELTIDGMRVTRDELTPGYTDYTHHLQVQQYDVTSLLRPGASELRALLADGWYRGQVGLTRAADQWGDRTAFLAQLTITYEDGSTTTTGTGDSWQWSHSHITVADLIEGQHEDRRLVGVHDWRPVAAQAVGTETLVVSPSPPVRAIEEIVPVAVTEVGSAHVVDLGRNINGRVRLTSLGPAGTELVLTHGEAVDSDGDVTTEHLVPDVPFLPQPLTAGQVDRVVSAGVDGDVFEPRFTTHGFRYVRVEGHPGPLSTVDVTGVVVHTDLRPRGTFRCDDDRANRLHEAAVWSFRGNACDIPTDCPTRERAGWTGDWQLFAPTATYLYDVHGFSVKWLRDLAAAQWTDGTLNNMAPMPVAERTGPLRGLNGSAGWGDAIVLVPWELYQEYGDVAVLVEMWPHITRWLDRARRLAAAARHPDRIVRRPEPAAHEKHLWDNGFHWGEWLVPGEDVSDFAAFIAADKGDTATAYLAWSARHASAIAALLGDTASAARYDELAEAASAAWRAEYVNADGHVVPHTQANLVRALSFGLVADEHRQRVADDLAALVTSKGKHLGTGFLATPLLLPALADHGHLDLAYALLFQNSPPSWLTMIDRGATTVWESWEGVDENGTPHESLNHYSKGAVISFLHRYVAGLRRVEPTWRRFRVEPRPGGGIRSTSTTHTTRHGTISVAWRLDDERFALELDVPSGTVAEVRLPGETAHEVGPGIHRLACRMPDHGTEA